MLVLDGKIAAAAVKESLKIKTAQLAAEGKRKPHLAAILVGNNGASETYVASKVKNCEETGFASTLIRLADTIDEASLLSTIHELNSNPSIDGILVQLPLPKQISEQKVIEAIDPLKDVDGFHPINVGKLVQGLSTFIPATPYGIMLMLEHYKIETKGKHAIVIGRSNIVGRPMSILLSSNLKQGNCTVTICHSHTPNLKELCLQADIIVAALGRPGFVTADMVKPGAVIIDVGITRVDDSTAKKGFRIKGDVAYEEVATKASAITPVPGGVGLMTIAGLLKNTMQAYEQRADS
ncbi:MAG: bifunctional 5,10-methylenetetrahydrofolate dehydrogenase/5,10-methenyltetrahydrofolate cyclohydrolase [Sediminibacterium sp. Gen4]|jgi:methylenetetrahydrofolate dehydrogenase (NADP+) / methenyltetrahydrofolate cyclohydrolase|uniref:bifunctional 5,10-methylenetetrahydrofolate dehydrogenase/5,10-methenyltetrahydrofolate cyclohydrolase n=1 Tax=unclassified Sediminibacterium TaxID=2635961 RepID=UPI0015BC8EA0|nr:MULTISPECIES: bifunctional 5,10-methylenetetrahydrofolate dehydrogenase/5,10-methenyltetrahydrofolate cyclohydrolase [unclassified Sediminibacterium]MBW0160435.1 bifunctional 5,10-methylenetetrahydrofolate dehydrogenase/5,10-methenyltetrahydrofolate cyclohydrolase [Sediminibacterium sp.]MBW0165452.1 bifunctional 5,10-methylenetetrahydrofolate dehydrogenase/5,10-methenyltetrahydrofolate cyclohydrolase [Sediminibacterium sp.]NWK65395.1 bifunctional 5,10-methylenetetrahydrofolate dehydrogenase/5